MALLVSSNTPERLEIGARVYLLKPPTVAERAKWRRATTAAGGRQYGQLALLAAMADGVKALMASSPAEIRDAVLAKIEAHRQNVIDLAMALQSGAYDDVPGRSDEDQAEARDSLKAKLEALDASGKALAVIEMEVAAGFPRYADMAAQDGLYRHVSGIEGARLFLAGWEGFDLALARGPSGVSEECLSQIPEQDFPRIGDALENLTRVPDAKRKNSVSPPPASSGGGTSTT